MDLPPAAVLAHIDETVREAIDHLTVCDCGGPVALSQDDLPGRIELSRNGVALTIRTLDASGESINVTFTRADFHDDCIEAVRDAYRLLLAGVA